MAVVNKARAGTGKGMGSVMVKMGQKTVLAISLWLCMTSALKAAAPAVVIEEALKLALDEVPLLDDETEQATLPSISRDEVEAKLAQYGMGQATAKSTHNDNHDSAPTATTPSGTGDDEVLGFSTYEGLGQRQRAHVPVARIDATTAPIGLELVDARLRRANIGADVGSDGTAAAETPSQTPADSAGIDPSLYLPEYQDTGSHPDSRANEMANGSTQTDTKKPPNLIKRVYNRLFHDGVDNLPRLESTIYLASVSAPETPSVLDARLDSDGDGRIDEGAWVYERDYLAYLDRNKDQLNLTRADEKQQPFNNIKAALDNITQESALDFMVALPRLREVVISAARAVGYYDVDFFLKDQGGGNIDVLIYKVGEPVMVASTVMDVRGDGEKLPVVSEIQDKSLQVGDVFRHDRYETSKAAIDALQTEHGFFDGRWLNSSVDVLLPDNTADISLVYDTGTQYVFDDVVFFTIDPETGKFTTDPDKLPVKLPLLQKLVSFETGDAFRQSKVSRLSSDLIGTQYFNQADVGLVLPSTDDDAVGSVDMPVSADEANHVNSAVPTDTVLLDEADQVAAEISPIDFSPSQAMLDKLTLVTAKAENLYNSPDDRVLGESKRNSSLLGRVSDAISGIAKRILPDESKDGMVIEAEAIQAMRAEQKSPMEVKADKKVPLYVFVQSDKPRDAQLGLGWGSDTGARLTGRFEHHLINRSGTQAGFELSLSQRMRRAGIYATRPLSHPLNDTLGLTLKYTEEQLDQGEGSLQLSTRSIEQSISRKKIHENNWSRSYGMRYRLDELKSDVPAHTLVDLPVRFVESRSKQQALLFGLNVSKGELNHLTAPTRGYRQSYSLEYGSAKLGSDTDMLIARAGLGGVYSFGDNIWGQDRAHQLVGRLDLGYLWADDFNDVPYKLRFFAGGDQSIRGYNFESLSPLSANGYLTGGQALAVASAEYNYEFREGLRAAVFADVGNAYDAKFSNDTKLGVGVGVRWASPVGTVRVDVAQGVGDDKIKTPIRLLFLIGLPF